MRGILIARTSAARHRSFDRLLEHGLTREEYVNLVLLHMIFRKGAINTFRVRVIVLRAHKNFFGTGNEGRLNLNISRGVPSLVIPEWFLIFNFLSLRFSGRSN